MLSCTLNGGALEVVLFMIIAATRPNYGAKIICLPKDGGIFVIKGRMILK